MPTHHSRLWTYSLPVALSLLGPFNLLASLGMDIYLPIVPVMPVILATTPEMVQLTLTLYMILLGVGQVIFGPLSDRLGRRPVLIAGALLFALSSFALAATSTAPAFLGLRVLQAIGASAALVAVFATIRDVFADKPESAVIYSLMNAMLAFVPALGPILGAVIAEAVGWRYIFVALGIPAILFAGFALPAWHETHDRRIAHTRASFGPMLRSLAFWTYTVAFGTAMGAFFVFFSTAPRVLVDGAGFSQMGFSIAFATVAAVMILTTRFAKGMVARWGIEGCVVRGMSLLIIGACALLVGETAARPSFWTFIPPMWVIAVGIVLTVSVTANGALSAFDDSAGTAVALHFCVQSLIVGLLGTASVIFLDGDSAWPLLTYILVMAILTLAMLLALGRWRAT